VTKLKSLINVQSINSQTHPSRIFDKPNLFYPFALNQKKKDKQNPFITDSRFLSTPFLFAFFTHSPRLRFSCLHSCCNLRVWLLFCPPLGNHFMSLDGLLDNILVGFWKEWMILFFYSLGVASIRGIWFFLPFSAGSRLLQALV
jgi:hypothetical protein